MTKVLLEIMQDLKTEWGILKDDSLAKIDRRSACEKIVELSEQAKVIDSKFEIIDMNNTKYSEFLPKKYQVKSNVNWGTIEKMTKKELTALELVHRLESIAVEHIKKKLPNEAEDSQKFGMIVSAFTEKLIKVYQFQNYSSINI